MNKLSKIALSACLAVPLGAGAARAATDLVVNYGNVQLHASSPTADTGTVTVPMVFNTGYSKAAPFQLPCDVTEFSAGFAWGYGGTGPGVYPELSGWLYLNGDEHQPVISHGYENTVPGGFDHRNAPDNSIEQLPGQTLSEGFIYLTQSVPFWQYGFQGSDLPTNTPVKLHLMVVPYSCSTYDFVEGGYSPACKVGDAVPWNNAVNIWIQRTCS